MNDKPLTDQKIYDRARHLADLYRLAAEVYGSCPALGQRNKEGEYVRQTYREVYDKACALGTALIELGLQPREHVALLADNRPEWLICDAATLLCGCADVPRAADVTQQEISYIVAHSDSVLVIAENLAVLKKVQGSMVALPKVRQVILIDGEPPEGSGVLRYSDLLERGKHLRQCGDRVIEERIDQVKGEDLFTMIYTSGTTGTPKGVMLTHDNMLSQVRYLPFELFPTDRVLSILPVWHSYERVFEMVAVARGCCTYYTSVRTVADDLRKIKPTMMASAPRLWEGLYSRILQKVRTGPRFSRMLFQAAYRCSKEYQSARAFLSGQTLDLVGRSTVESLKMGVRSFCKMLIFALPAKILDGLVLHKIRAVVGGEFRGTVSGGGALPPHVDEFFNYIGIPVLEGYGMTETSPVLAVRTWNKRVIGTVGPFWPHTDIRIVDHTTGEVLYPSRRRGGGRGLKGEIHARGPQVMRGYYKNPEATDKVLDDGWMNTGDIGMVTFNDCLKILGRSKETIVLLNGENVEPMPIEAQLLESRFIDQCLVIGQDEKHLAALIVPSIEALKEQGFSVNDLSEAAHDEQVIRLLGAEVRRLVSKEFGFKPFETIQGFRIIPKSFEVGDELTATFKPRRHVITERYEKLIDEMFHHSRSTKQF